MGASISSASGTRSAASHNSKAAVSSSVIIPMTRPFLALVFRLLVLVRDCALVLALRRRLFGSAGAVLSVGVRLASAPAAVF